MHHYLAIVDAESARNGIKWRNGQKLKNNGPKVNTTTSPATTNEKCAKKRNSEAGNSNVSNKAQSSCRIS